MVPGPGDVLVDDVVVKAKYFAGDVPAPYGCSAFKGHYYAGKLAVQADGSTTVHYTDGSLETNVARENLKVLL